MHQLLRLITMTLALTAPALAFADAPAMKDDLPTTPIDRAVPDDDLRKEDGGDADRAAAQRVPDVSLDLLCDTLAVAAHKSGLPVSFFANLIWQESRFVFRAVSPAGALGIAQFMPKTAAAMGLTDPFDPLKALPASARLLSGLFQRFGNLGLTAAAYNAGEARVSNWLSEKSGLPQETRNYVLAITGFPVEHWKEAAKGLQSFKLAARMPCRDHEAFADAGEALDESNIVKSSVAKPAPSAQAAPRLHAPSVASSRIRKAAKLRKDERLGSTRGRNSGARQALGQERGKARAPDAG
jgi:transglycosylase-like protein with SLT domain